MVNPSPLKLPITAEDKTRAAFQSVQANLARTQAALRAMSAQWQSVERDTAAATNSIAAVGTHLSRLVPLLSIGAVASFGRNIVNSIGGLGELADQLGISTDLLQTLQATAIQSGVSVEQLEASMLKFTRTIGDAVSGSDDAIDRFRQLGVGLLDANGKTRSTLEIMQDVAVAISQIEDPTRRALMQFELFGKSGQRMQVLLQELSREGIEPMIGRMKEAGAVAQEDVIKRFDEISDRAAFAGKQFVVFSSSIIDGFIGIAGRAVEAAQRVGQFFGLFDQPLDKQLAAAETLLQRQTQLLERMVSGGRANKRDIDEQTAAVEAYRKKVEELRAAMSAPAPSAPATPTLPGSPILPVGKKEMEDQRKQIEAAEKAIADYNARIDQTILSLDPVAAATRRWSDQQAMLIDALDKGMVDLERYNELILASDMQYRDAVQRTMNVVELSGETAKKTDDIARELGFTFQSAFEDAIVRGEKFRNVLAGIAQDIARIMIRQTVTTPLAGMFNNALGGIGGLLGGLFAGPGDIRGPGGSTSIPFGGPRAAGGPVASGTAYLVGEEGPELFMPGSSGRIVPNGQSVGGVTVNQTIQISAGVAQTVRAEVLGMLPRIKRETLDAVADARMRGGSFAAAMGT